VKVAFVLPDDAPGVAERLAAATACGLVRAGHTVETLALRTATSPFPGHPGRGEIRPLDGPVRAGAKFDAVAGFGPRVLVEAFALDADAYVHVLLDEPHSDSATPDRTAGAALLVTSEARRGALAARHGDEVFVLPTYVDGAVYRPGPAPPDGRPLQAMVEPFGTPEEGLAFAAAVTERAPAVRLWQLSAPTDRSEMAHGIRLLEPPLHARPALLRGCGVYVATASRGSDVAVLEAMATGLVVVASVGTEPELLRDGVNALLVAPGDAAGAAQALARVAADPALRARLRTGALATARERDVSVWEPVAIAAFLRAVALGRKPSAEERRAAAELVERLRHEPRPSPVPAPAKPAPARRSLRHLWAAAVGAFRPVAPHPRSAPAPPESRVSAGAPDEGGRVLFCGNPTYFRSAWADAVRDGWGIEHPVRPHERGAFERLPEVAERAGVRTCVAFDPWQVADRPAVLAALRAAGVRLVAFSAEPVPHTADRRAHWDALRRFEDFRRARDAGFDLWIHHDASSQAFLEAEGFRPLAIHPLPVSEHLFHPENVTRDVDACFLGWSTPHREAFLEPLKTRLRTVHVAHGVFDEDARRLMNRSKVVVNLHPHEYLNFETRCVQALFCGRPLVSEELSGGYLVPERDYLLARTPEEVLARVREAMEDERRAWPTPSFDRSRFLVTSLRDLLRARLKTTAGS
jgi:hypothetical protein